MAEAQTTANAAQTDAPAEAAANPRGSGILLHPTSLPGPYGIGDLGPAAYAWVDVPGALPLSAWIGPYGISFLVVLSGTAVALSIERRRWEPAVVGLTLPLLLLPVAARWSLRRSPNSSRAAIAR